jgi:hypothetical protein
MDLRCRVGFAVAGRAALVLQVLRPVFSARSLIAACATRSPVHRLTSTHLLVCNSTLFFDTTDFVRPPSRTLARTVWGLLAGIACSTVSA